MAKIWCVLDLDVGLEQPRKTLATLIEYDDLSMAFVYFCELSTSENVERLRHCRGCELTFLPGKADLIPNPNRNSQGCEWMTILRADDVPYGKMDDVLRKIPPRNVVCVATRWHGTGARELELPGEGLKYVSAILFECECDDEPWICELRNFVSRADKMKLTQETNGCLECGIQFFWYDRNAPDATRSSCSTYSPTCYQLIQETDLEDWDFMGSRHVWEANKAKIWSQTTQFDGSETQAWGVRICGQLAGLLMATKPMPESWKSKIGDYLCWVCMDKLTTNFEHIWSH